MTLRLVGFVTFKNDAPVLRQCLTRLSEVADTIVALDDGSSDGSLEIARSFPKIERWIQHPPGGVWNARRNLRKKLEIMRELNPQWIINVDPDDVIDRRFVEQADVLLANAQVGRYTFQEVTLWDGNTHYRTDKPEWYQRAVSYSPILFRWNPSVQWHVGTRTKTGDWINRLSHSATVGWLKQVLRPTFLKGAKRQPWYAMGQCFFPTDYMNFTNGKFIGYQGSTVNLELKKIHYHFYNLEYAAKKHLNYALTAAIKQHRLENEIPELIDWAMAKLSPAGLQLAPVRPEWGVL